MMYAVSPTTADTLPYMHDASGTTDTESCTLHVYEKFSFLIPLSVIGIFSEITDRLRVFWELLNNCCGDKNLPVFESSLTDLNTTIQHILNSYADELLQKIDRSAYLRMHNAAITTRQAMLDITAICREYHSATTADKPIVLNAHNSLGVDFEVPYGTGQPADERLMVYPSRGIPTRVSNRKRCRNGIQVDINLPIDIASDSTADTPRNKVLRTENWLASRASASDTPMSEDKHAHTNAISPMGSSTLSTFPPNFIGRYHPVMKPRRTSDSSLIAVSPKAPRPTSMHLRRSNCFYM